MRSGWPHTQDDHGGLPADQRRAPFGPDISWPTGYSNLEYRDGDYRYPAQQAPAPANHGEHPYAAFSADGYGAPGGYPRSSADFGYGDPGYSDPGYDGPAAQDAGIAGTRTVRGYVEAPPAQDYAPAGYEYAAPDYDEPGRIELAYPLPYREQENYPEAYNAADTYRQPWDYDQPLRYEGDLNPRSPLPGVGLPRQQGKQRLLTAMGGRAHIRTRTATGGTATARRPTARTPTVRRGTPTATTTAPNCRGPASTAPGTTCRVTTVPPRRVTTALTCRGLASTAPGTTCRAS